MSKDDDEAQKQVKEVLDDAKKVQGILSQYGVNTKEYMHSIPILMCEFYPNKKTMIDTFELLAKEAVAWHDMIYKEKK